MLKKIVIKANVTQNCDALKLPKLKISFQMKCNEDWKLNRVENIKFHAVYDVFAFGYISKQISHNRQHKMKERNFCNWLGLYSQTTKLFKNFI